MKKNSLLLSIVILITSLLPKTCIASAPSEEGKDPSYSVTLRFYIDPTLPEFRVRTSEKTLTGKELIKICARSQNIAPYNIDKIVLYPETVSISDDEKIYDTDKFEDKLLVITFRV